MKKELISQSNAKQRKGRTGRTVSGYCFHLYTEEELKKELELRSVLEGLLKSIEICYLRFQREGVSAIHEE